MRPNKKNLFVLQQENKSLPVLVAHANLIERMLAESLGELTPEIEEKLHFNGIQMREKVDAYGHMLDMLPARAEYYKRKAEIYTRIARAIAKTEERMELMLRQAMSEMKTTEIKGGEYRFALSRVKPALVIDDEAQVPEDLKMVEQSLVIDKERIRHALEKGMEVPGCRMEERFALRKYENRDDE